VSGTHRRRATVVGLPLTIQPAEDEIEAFAPRGFAESVVELAAGPTDRAEGRRRFEVVVDGWRFEVTVEPAERAELRERAARAAAEHQVAADVTLRAAIPGRVARLWVSAGEAVEQGQRLLAIEAMKMENEIRAPRAGRVRSISVEPGARVERDDELLTVE